MIKLYILIVFALCFYVFLHSRWFKFLNRAWHEKNLYSKKQKLTMFDVRQLLLKGEKELAVKVYCELFKTSPEESIKAVEEIERSIQPKDFER